MNTELATTWAETEEIPTTAPLSSLNSHNSQSIPVNQRSWPQMDKKAFHGLAGEVVHLINPHTEADPVAILIQVLVAVGNVIGRFCYYTADGTKHYLNLFVVLTGITSKGRKGTSSRHVINIFEQVDSSWTTNRIQSGLSSGEGLIWAVRDPVVTSRRGKQDPGVEDKRLLTLEGEFASVLRVLGRDGNTLSAVIRQAWDNGNLQTLTKNSPAKATAAHISIIGHITKDELRRELDKTEMANGLGNRFLWLCVHRSKCLPEGGKIEKVDFKTVIQQLSKAVVFAKKRMELRFHEEARKYWHEIYPALSDGKPGMFGAMTSRAEAQVVRLACIYALLDCSGTIKLQHLEAALALWNYCEASVSYIFGNLLGDPLADELLRMLKHNAMSLTEIHGIFKNHKKADQIDRALSLLKEHKLALSKPVQTGGRPSEIWSAM